MIYAMRDVLSQNNIVIDFTVYYYGQNYKRIDDNVYDITFEYQNECVVIVIVELN